MVVKRRIITTYILNNLGIKKENYGDRPGLALGVFFHIIIHGRTKPVNCNCIFICHCLIIIAGTCVTLLVNNLGGTSNLELLVMANAAIRYLGRCGRG